MNGPSIERFAEIAYATLLLVVAGVIWREAGRLAPAPYDPLGPKFMPMAVSALLAALAVIMLARIALGRSLGRATQSMVVGFEDAADHAQRPIAAGATVALAFAYATALSFRAIPFVLATAAYLFLAGLVLGSFTWRRVAGVAAFALIASLVVDFVFRTVFRLDLA